MVIPISVPGAKYDLLIDSTEPCWKVFCICLSIVTFVTFVTFAPFGTSVWWFAVTPEEIVVKSPPEEIVVKSPPQDATLAAWIRRARMYAESTKANQNAERNQSTGATVDEPHRSQFSRSLVCYYTIPEHLNATTGLGPSNLDAHLCTHIIVGFASVVNCTLDLGKNSWLYEKVAELKNRESKLKVMISVGGGNEAHSGFPQMVANHANRKIFIRSVLNATKALKLDGLDVDWEFPSWMTSDDRQKIHFVQLLQELRRHFDRSGRNLILSVAVAAPQVIVDQSYNVPQMAEHVDFVNLMAYDYHYYVWYLPVTGLNAPLYPRSTEKPYSSTSNVNFSANYWVSQGMPREKIVVGIPSYGHSFKLDNSANHGLEAPANSVGQLGGGGFVDYSTVCWFLQTGAQKVFDNESKVPYAFKDYEWISYDDIDSVTYKAEWIRASGFKGAMILSLNVDDYNATCTKNLTFPLTRTVAKVLQESPGDF